MITKEIKVGNILVGGNNKITIQSMSNIPFSRFDELKEQSLSLEKEGCDILRVSVPDMESVKGFHKLKQFLNIPLVADIHFDYRLAIEAIAAGADKIRINPGNIGNHLKEVADAARKADIPIRVGVNAGSLEKKLLEKYEIPTAEALAESAFINVDKLRNCDFDDIIVSMKSSDVTMMVESYRLFHDNSEYPYPLHVGVTESGTSYTGMIKSSIGIGSLLIDGIGDTIRVSLTADPIEEIKAAKVILRALGLRQEGIEVISCPTCGRTTTDTISLANYIEKEYFYIKKPLQIAVMGCIVNGPGESLRADLGVTGANGEYIFFKKGKIIRKVSEKDIYNALKEEIEALL